MTKLAFVDLETTGLDSDRCHPWEIAIITRDGDGTPDMEHLYCILPDLTTAEPMGLTVGRFYERTATLRPPHPTQENPSALHDLCNVPAGSEGYRWSSASGVALKAAQLLDGRHIIGKVPDFDVRFLHRFIRSAGLTLTAHYHLIDVETLTVGYLRGIQDAGGYVDAIAELTPPWKSRELDAALGIIQPEDEQHTALGDARVARAVWDMVMTPAPVPPGHR